MPTFGALTAGHYETNQPLFRKTPTYQTIKPSYNHPIQTLKKKQVGGWPTSLKNRDDYSIPNCKVIIHSCSINHQPDWVLFIMIFHGFSHGFLWAFLMVPVPEKRLRSQVHERTPLSRSLASHQILRQNPRQQKNPKEFQGFFSWSICGGKC